MTCPECGYSDDKRLNVYGTICPKCKKHIPASKRSDLQSHFDDKYTKMQLMAQEYLEEKIRNANRRTNKKH